MVASNLVSAAPCNPATSTAPTGYDAAGAIWNGMIDKRPALGRNTLGADDARPDWTADPEDHASIEARLRAAHDIVMHGL
jgi:hypothetical protein